MKSIIIDGKTFVEGQSLAFMYGPKRVPDRGLAEITSIDNERTFTARKIGTFYNRIYIAASCKLIKERG